MKLEIAKVGEMTLIAGIVTGCREGSGASAGRVVNVKIRGSVFNPDKKAEEEKTIDVAFWNSEENDRMLADRVIKAGVGVGSFITALVMMKEDNKATGLNFKYGGIWKFPAADGRKELNVIVGTVSALDEDAEGRFVKASVPVSLGKDKETEWHKITFWNSEKAAMADRAKICLKPRADGRKVRAVIVCGECELYNGKPNYTGFRFEIVPEK